MDYSNEKDAEDAKEALNGKVIGGEAINLGKSIFYFDGILRMEQKIKQL